jgi:hypothetical protein
MWVVDADIVAEKVQHPVEGLSTGAGLSHDLPSGQAQAGEMSGKCVPVQARESQMAFNHLIYASPDIS